MAENIYENAEIKRRRKLAEALRGASTNISPMANPSMTFLTSLLSSAVGGYQEEKANALEEQRRKQYNQVLAQALKKAGETGKYGSAVDILSGNDMTQPLALQFQMKDIENKQALEKEALKEKLATLKEDKRFERQADLLERRLTAQDTISKRNLASNQLLFTGKEAIAQQKDLAKELESTGLSGLNEALNSLDAKISQVPQGKIEGIGLASGQVPSFALSTEGKQLRQDLAQVQNLMLKARSGAAITPNEFERLKEELGTGFRTEEQLRIGIKNAKKFIDNKVNSIQAGYLPQAVQSYQERKAGINPAQDMVIEYDSKGQRIR